MKKAIRFILMAVVLVIMAASCKKSSIISGRWELVHVHVYDDNNYAQPIETWRPADQGMRTYYEFLSNGVLLRTEVSNLGYGITESRGTWNVDGDILIITFAAVKTINEFGGKVQNAVGVPEDQIREAVKSAVCKVNIDSDGRLAMTAAIRKHFVEHPEHYDPRQYLTDARNNLIALYKHKCSDEVLNSAGKSWY